MIKNLNAWDAALTLTLALLGSLASGPAAWAQAASPKTTMRASPAASPGTLPTAIVWPDAVQAVVGHVVVLRLPQAVSRVVVGDPQVADYHLISRQELYVLGKSVGTTNLVLWQPSGQTVSLSVKVGADLTPLADSLKLALPQETNITLMMAASSVVLGGSVSNTLAADVVLGLTEAHLRRAGNVTTGSARIVNMLRVRDAQQVMLDVRIAEVSKSLLDKLGLKVQASGGGDIRWNVLSNFLGGGNASAGLLFSNGNSINLDAEKQDGLVRILAEPTIVAMSGQEGSFLVGGKVFIPITQSSGAAGNAVTLQEREFGVGLKFVPTVLDGGRISLKVAPEVSEISRESISASSASGSTLLPAFTTRRVSTTVQLQDGQSLVIGGLLRNNSTASRNAFPLLGELPIIGALFRSSQFAADLTELVVVVRASLVQATEAAPALPTDTLSMPSRRDFFLNGRLQGGTPGNEAETKSAP